ncbi:lysoplasmalogenase [Caulobacter sp. NIBR1757]|uniref:lysoplasmalogenase n=1 Tax=Caulobacter sp. NIBR1757 TaxID=3016000 RepID=UPI0022F11CFB|nr:lysoplasmalogenase [Caulobacter sp. NIBR1757]WGM37303.1 hypothetical protein AMEJIAPC_00200 [Caulobacter sp. NIBR1757]
MVFNGGTSALIISLAAGLIYGLGFAGKPPSALRTIVKMMAVGALALFGLWMWLGDATVQQQADSQAFAEFLHSSRWIGGAAAIGLTLCAIGDGFLAGDPKRWLLPGLVAFLLGHVAYVAMFLMPVPDPWGEPTLGLAGWIVAGVVVAATVWMLRWLWPSLGDMRWPVVAYAVVITAMVVASLTVSRQGVPLALAALMFMASDAILAAEMFKGVKLFGSPRLTAWLIWFLYFGSQLLFAGRFLSLGIG